MAQVCKIQLQKQDGICSKLSISGNINDQVLTLIAITYSTSINISMLMFPFQGRGWWREQEEPWQTLACCRELTAALRNPTGPANYVNHFPVHQDGSCNGLQHYAAMGRDERGAASVSLEDCVRPRDVYTDVAEVVRYFLISRDYST